MKKIFILVFIIAASFAACKKEIAPGPTCKINKIVSEGDTINLTYNSQGKLGSITRGIISTTFIYSGNSIIGIGTSSGVFTYKKIITLNDNGLASNVRTESDQTGTTWSNIAYEYNGTELQKSTSTNSTGGTQKVMNYNWVDGNMTSYVSGSTTNTFEYYATILSQTGDYLDLSQLIAYGYEIFRNKNAVKSVSIGSNKSIIDYILDNKGKIVSLIVTGANDSSIDYQYQCN